MEDHAVALGVGVEVLHDEEDERSPVGSARQGHAAVESLAVGAAAPRPLEPTAGDVDRDVSDRLAVPVPDDRAAGDGLERPGQARRRLVLVARAVAVVRDARAAENVAAAGLAILDEPDRLAAIRAVDAGDAGDVALVPDESHGVSGRSRPSGRS